jgi:hypothetical protein
MIYNSVLPNDMYLDDRSKILSVTVSGDLEDDEIYDPVTKETRKYVTFPVEVITDILVEYKKWDKLICTEVGGPNGAPVDVENQIIYLETEDGFVIDLGDKNKMQQVSYTNDNLDSEATNIRYRYLTYNRFGVWPVDQQPNKYAKWDFENFKNSVRNYSEREWKII